MSESDISIQNIDVYKYNLVKYAEDICGIKLTEYQKDLLNTIDNMRKQGSDINNIYISMPRYNGRSMLLDLFNKAKNDNIL